MLDQILDILKVATMGRLDNERVAILILRVDITTMLIQLGEQLR